MQIWKFYYTLSLFIWNQYPENLRVLQLFTREVWIILKKVGYFLTYSIVSVCLLTNISYIGAIFKTRIR